MKLSELVKNMTEVELVVDTQVNALGMATSQFNEKRVLSFVSNEKYIDSILNNDSIVAIVCSKEVMSKAILPSDMGIVLSKNPQKSFFTLHNQLVEDDFYWQKFENDIAESSTISKHAIIGEHSIKIGENCLIEPGVIISPGTIIGDEVVIRSGTQIGTSGFQFIKDGNSVLQVKTGGRTVLHDRVEIQHNCCVDRGVLGGDTILKEDVKLDNFVHVAHDDYIGERTFITAGVKLAGRVVIGKDCWLGVNATVSNGITIGDNSKITLGSVVTKDVDSGSVVTGNFAIDHKKFIEFIKSIS